MHDASHQPETVREEPSIDLAHRRAVNDRLAKSRPGHVCAVLFPSAKTPGGPKLRGQVVVVKLPRGSAGKVPRRGVHIPLPTFATARLARESKHRLQRHRDGMFGKTGARTVERKQEFLAASRGEANALAAGRRLQRRNRK